jgi:hypothetical protein
MEELKHNSNEQNSSYEEYDNSVVEEHIEDSLKNDVEDNIEFEDKEEGGNDD